VRPLVSSSDPAAAARRRDAVSTLEAPDMLKILIADDHPMFRAAVLEVVQQLVAADEQDCTCTEVTDSQELFAALAHEDDFDLILLDLFMPGSNGLADLVRVRDKAPGTPIVVISSLGDEATIRQSLTCGAAGFVPKSSPKAMLLGALREVLAGRVYTPAPAVAVGGPLRRRAASTPSDPETGPLTARQVRVMALLATGKSNKQIANDLDISEMTVKAHMTSILRKLGVSTRAQAIVAFQRAPQAEQFTAGLDQPGTALRSR
jgi:DNA-binding NarL/FixJ family response regulator